MTEHLEFQIHNRLHRPLAGVADVVSVVDAAAGVGVAEQVDAAGLIVADIVAVVDVAEQVGAADVVAEVDVLAAEVDVVERAGVADVVAEADGLLVLLHLAVYTIDMCGSTTAYIPLQNSMDYYNLDIDSF